MSSTPIYASSRRSLGAESSGGSLSSSVPRPDPQNGRPLPRRQERWVVRGRERGDVGPRSVLRDTNTAGSGRVWVTVSFDEVTYPLFGPLLPLLLFFLLLLLFLLLLDLTRNRRDSGVRLVVDLRTLDLLVHLRVRLRGPVVPSTRM